MYICDPLTHDGKGDYLILNFKLNTYCTFKCTQFGRVVQQANQIQYLGKPINTLPEYQIWLGSYVIQGNNESRNVIQNL